MSHIVEVQAQVRDPVAESKVPYPQPQSDVL